MIVLTEQNDGAAHMGLVNLHILGYNSASKVMFYFCRGFRRNKNNNNNLLFLKFQTQRVLPFDREIELADFNSCFKYNNTCRLYI